MVLDFQGEIYPPGTDNISHQTGKKKIIHSKVSGGRGIPKTGEGKAFLPESFALTWRAIPVSK